MKYTLYNYPQTTQATQVGLIRLLLVLILATASLSAFGARKSAPVNNAPDISGTPTTSVVAGSNYYFQPTVTDDNEGNLRFSISNQPAWASFSGKSGRLSGTPGTADVGTYSNIVITVSERNTSASLPPFNIQVQAASGTSGGTTGGSATDSVTTELVTTPVQVGSLTLQWSAPVTRADGTPLSLSEIDGYRIYYGVSTGNYPNQIDVTDGTAQAVTVTDMPVGTYYLVMTTYDISGNESAYSSMVTKNAE
jgi:hypothetical protein